jgi:hypothetical protein
MDPSDFRIRLARRVAGMPVKALVKTGAADPGLAQFTSSLGVESSTLGIFSRRSPVAVPT